MAPEREADDVTTLRERVATLEASLAEAVAARDAAERQSRIKSEFLSLLSHELRSPLQTLQLQMELLERLGPRDAERWMRGLERARSASRRLVRLVNHVLEFRRSALAGQPALRAEKLDVQTLAEQVVRDVRAHGVRDGVALGVAPGGPALLRTDPGAVYLLLVNLVDNAVRYTDEGSVTVTVTARPDGVALAVSDTGRGIPATDLDRVFRPFERGDESVNGHTGGVGIGLALVRRMIDLLGGRLDVESTPGAGSTFTAHLPPLDVEPGDLA